MPSHPVFTPGMNHPDPDALNAFLHGRLAPGERSAVDVHLRSCPACAATASALVQWQDALCDVPDVPVSSSWTWRRFAVAAAVLLVAGGWLLSGERRGVSSPSRPGPRVPGNPGIGTFPGAYLALEGKGELLSSSGSACHKAGEAWELEHGSFLALTRGETLLRSAQREILLQEGEFLIRLPPAGKPVAGIQLLPPCWADAAPPLEIHVLRGRASVRLDRRVLEIREGTVLTLADGREPLSSPLDHEACNQWIGAILGSSSGDARPGGHGLGSASWQEGRLHLEGGSGLAAWLAEPRGDTYVFWCRLRTLVPPSKLGVSITMDGASTLWIPEEQALLADGKTHTLGVLLTRTRVTLMVDGVARENLPRHSFRSNPGAGLEGVGPVLWGGQVEFPEFRLETLP